MIVWKLWQEEKRRIVNEFDSSDERIFFDLKYNIQTVKDVLSFKIKILDCCFLTNKIILMKGFAISG